MPVKTFHDYLVYSDGRIYSNLTNKFLKLDCYGSYAKITLRIDGEPKCFSVHRLVAYLFCNPPDNYSELEVDHLDNNHFNNSAENLEWVTCAENNRRAREKGFNNVSLSNSNRWNDEEFRKKTAQNISAGQISSGCFSGKKNLNGADIPEFKNCGITSIVDLKGKVNRLSKA